MTAARPLRSQQTRARLRVVRGAGASRATFAPFLMFGVVVVTAMIGLVIARTSLDAGAFELSDMRAEIAALEVRQYQLQLDVARLESPGRIAPLAEEMGMVLPDERLVLLVDDPAPVPENQENLVATVDPRLAMPEIEPAIGSGG